MYAVLNENKQIIAYHEEYDICEMYTNNIYRFHGVNLNIIKIKKKTKHLLDGLDDLYLVRYGLTYVQIGYIDYFELESSQVIDDVRYAKDVIYHMLERGRIKDKKDIKAAKHIVGVLEDIMYSDSLYTPTISDLKNMKIHYDPYFYNCKLY